MDTCRGDVDTEEDGTNYSRNVIKIKKKNLISKIN